METPITQTDTAPTTQIAVFAEKMGGLAKAMDELKQELRGFRGEIRDELKSIRTENVSQTEFKALKADVEAKVDKIEFAPVKGIAYGMVTVILLAVIGAIVALVIK